MSFFGLGLMGKTLDTFQYAENVTSDNIANVDTPGASRQVVDLSQALPVSGSPFYAAHLLDGTFGDGVTVAQVQRIHDESYDELFRGASASQNYYATQESALNGVQSVFGDPSSGANVEYTAFQTAVSNLIANAGAGPEARQSVLSAAQALASSLNASATAVAQQKAQALAQGSQRVTHLNGILDQIAELNGQIRASTAVADNANTFADQRDLLIDQLSQYLSTQTSIQPDGSALVAVNGQALVDDTVAYHLADPVVGIASNGGPAFKIDFQSIPAAPPSARGIPLGSGQLAALADLYNNKLGAYGAQLDDFAGSLASEVNHITQSAYDQRGLPGQALFVPAVSGLPVTAGNISVTMTDPAQLAVALASTASGSLVQPLNSANNSVDSGAPLNGYAALAAPPPAGGSTGTLRVTVNGVTQTIAYDTNTTDASIDAFLQHFKGEHLGVTASFDATSQKIVFARDPGNTNEIGRGNQQIAATPTDPTFTIADTVTTGTSLLATLGAAGIDGVTQNAGNAFGADDNGGANALQALFSLAVGVPEVQTTSGGPLALGQNTITLAPGITNVAVGMQLLLHQITAGVPPIPPASPAETVVVSAVAFTAGGREQVTFTTANAYGGAGAALSSAPAQTLGQYYGGIVTRLGIDAQTATSGAAQQTELAKNIDQARQSIDGINIDEETQNLLKYQTAYQAAARTVNVLDSLLATIVNNLGTP